MKLKTCHTTLIAAAFTLLMPLSVLAQEDKAAFDAEMTSKEGLKQQDQETPSGAENPENRTNRNSLNATPPENVVLRDTEIKTIKSAPKPAEKPQKEEEKAQKKEEDPLSFNFLYYIIEKFKLSDIVE